MNKQRIIRLDVAFGLCLWLMALTASAFYNPTAGRWLNRDPLGEYAGPNIYGFVGNDGVQKIDPDGRFIWLFFTGCSARRECDGRPYNPETHCCCEKKIVSRQLVDTGINIERWDGQQPVPGRGNPYHVWLTWDGESVDINAIIDTYRVTSPASGPTLYGTTPKRTTTPVKLSKCDHDFVKLKSCLSKKAAADKDKQFIGMLCDAYVNKLLADCKAESKGCTSN